MYLRNQVVAICGALALGVAAHAAPIAGVRGLDHVGVTVPDVNEAVGFFTQVLGCQEAFRFGPIRDDTGTLMKDLVNVDPRAAIVQIVMMRCGQGSNIELFQYTAVDQASRLPRNSDIGGHHLAFYVKDIAAAVEQARRMGLRTFLGPFKVEEGPAAGQSITYLLSPWGLQLELISYPNGMAYEKAGMPRLWTPPTE